MTDRIDRHRDEGMYIPPIEEGNKQKEKFAELPEDKEKKILFASFFSILKKVFDSLSEDRKIQGKIVDQQAVVDHLLQLSGLFEKLQEEDLSKSIEFTTDLSNCWCSLLEDFDAIEALKRKNLENLAHFREFMEEVKNFPPDSQHRLGFYLLQHAGADWLPFPFIEMLEKLHAEKETLALWQGHIDVVITNLKASIRFPIE